jgi:hypothetical protein
MPQWAKRQALMFVVGLVFTVVVVKSALFIFGWFGAIVAMVIVIPIIRWLFKRVAQRPH